jgi:Mg-chelatase subunit ChlI
VGQEKLKTAYLANLVNPRIGGLLISGPKGTGKSTIVHSIASLLPELQVVQGCPFNCDPSSRENLCSLCRERDPLSARSQLMRIINLPLSCTEDRLIGSIDVEALLREGKRQVQEGVLGQANRNILYVDEVNLLPDHLVDDILDAAAGHWNTIEREGISISHPTEFVLVGTMNPEEGELRPQILDRFPLCARVESIRDPELRVEIIKRNLLFERDPSRFCLAFAEQESRLRGIIDTARTMLASVPVDPIWLVSIASACAELKVDGQRPDIVIVKTAHAIAALDGRAAIGPSDILMASELALNHRTRDGGLLDPPATDEILSVVRKNLEGVRPGDGAEDRRLELDALHVDTGSFFRLDAVRTAGTAASTETGGEAGKKA